MQALLEQVKPDQDLSAKLIRFINPKLKNEKNFKNTTDIQLIVTRWMSDKNFRVEYIKLLKDILNLKQDPQRSKAREILFKTLKEMLKFSKNNPEMKAAMLKDCPAKIKPGFDAAILSILKSILVSIPKNWTGGVDYTSSSSDADIKAYYNKEIQSNILAGARKAQKLKTYDLECTTNMLKSHAYSLLEGYLYKIRRHEITRDKISSITKAPVLDTKKSLPVSKSGPAMKKEWETIPKSLASAELPELKGTVGADGDQYAHLNLLQHGVFLGRMSLILGTAALEGAESGPGQQKLPIDGLFPPELGVGADSTPDNSLFGGKLGRAGQKGLMGSNYEPWVYRTAEALLGLPSWGRRVNGQWKFSRQYHPFFNSPMKRKLALAYYCLWRNSGFPDVHNNIRYGQGNHDYEDLWDQKIYEDNGDFQGNLEDPGEPNSELWKTKKLCKNRSNMFTPTDYKGTNMRQTLHGQTQKEYCETNYNSNDCNIEKLFYRPLDAITTINTIADMDLNNLVSVSISGVRERLNRFKDINIDYLIRDEDNKPLYTSSRFDLELYLRILLLLKYWPGGVGEESQGVDWLDPKFQFRKQQGGILNGGSQFAVALSVWRDELIASKQGNSQIDITSTNLHKTKNYEVLSMLYVANSVFHFVKTHSHQDFINNLDKFDNNGTDYGNNCQWRKRWKIDYRKAGFGSTGVPDINK